MKSVVVLGATGSVGKQALEVLRGLGASFRVTGLAVKANTDLLLEQCREFRPTAVAITSEEQARRSAQELKRLGIGLATGDQALEKLIDDLRPDIVLQAVSGAAGLPASLAAVESGARLACANKESLVMAGHLILPLAEKRGVEIIPVDSEHSAIFQSLNGQHPRAARRIFLTASGGPFADATGDELERVTPEQALRHPTWKMGGKITIDSATMMNKALEIIEARWLFDCHPDRIEVVVHRQSIVHSMVEFHDGSIIAQMGVPDMRVPIRYALTYPERPPLERDFFDFDRWKQLTFEPPDTQRFPAIDLGFRAAREGGVMGTVLNAANEEAVGLFLKGTISFTDIASTVARVLDRTEQNGSPTLDDIMDADRWAREETLQCL